MQPELNPQIFGVQTQSEKNPSNRGMGSPSQGILPDLRMPTKPMNSPLNSPASPTEHSSEVKNLAHQVAVLKMALLQSEKRNDSLNGKVEELVKMLNNRFERFSQAIVRSEELQAKSYQETSGRLAQMSAKVNERRVNDTKIQELIDRHNTIVRNFENRLHSLQRLVSEQEMVLLNSQAALEETRAELAKRGR